MERIENTTKGDVMLVRRLVAVALTVIALGILVAALAGANAANDNVELALGDALESESTADSAPQQQVVNGWAAKDLLAIMAEEQTRNSQQQTGLMVLLIVGLAVLLFVRPGTDITPRRAPAGPSPAGPGPFPVTPTVL